MSPRRPWRARLSLYSGFLLVALTVSGCARDLRSNSILYIGWDERGRNQIYRLDQPAGTARALTTTDPNRPADVADFALSPDGETVAYSLVHDDGGSAIWGVSPRGGDATLLLDCPDAECTGLAWAADSRRVAYERRLRDDSGIDPPHLFWLDTRTSETLPLVAGDEYPSYGARFAPSGDWLGYVSLPDEGVVVYRESDGQQARLASYTGMPPAWSPVDSSLIISDLSLEVIHGEEGDDHTAHSHDYASAVHLFVIEDPLAEERRQLSPPGSVDDSAPAWSPSGEWVAFGRRYPDTASGRQLWLVREDGRDARPLTDDHLVHHGPPSWSADGERLLYQRVAAFEPDERSSIWVMDVGSGEQTQLVAEGFQPVWLGR